MRPLVHRMAFVASLFCAAPLMAQGGFGPPGGPQGRPPMMGAAGGMGAASKLLSHTGELQLTDQQVVKLAAIARREGVRRRALRAAMDSARRTAPMRRDSVGPPHMPPQLASAIKQNREQNRADLKEAITVLTTDQQAQAWQMMAARNAMARRAMRMRSMGGMMQPRGMMQGQGMGTAPHMGPNGMRQGGPAGGGAAQQRGRVGGPPVRPPEEADPA